MGRPQGLRGTLRQPQRSGKTAGKSLQRTTLPSQKPQGCPEWAVIPLVLRQGACVSRGRPPVETMKQQSSVGRPQGLREMLRQAEGKSGETAGNAESLPRRPPPTQKPPGLSWANCNAPGVGAGCLCLSQKAPTRENRTAGWPERAAGTQGNVEACKGEE